MLVMVLIVLLKRVLVLVMLLVMLRLRVRRLLLQLLNALLDVIRGIRVDLALGLGIDGLTELAELRELQLLLLHRVQQLLLACRRIQGVVLLAVRLRVAGHLVVHGERLARVAGGRTMAVSIHLSVSTDYVRVETTRPIVRLECAGKKSYLYVESAHSTTGRRRDGSDSVDCYASERSSRLDREYVERVDGETAQDVSEVQLRRDAMTTHPALPYHHLVTPAIITQTTSPF
jgi:hypothetical protein